MPVAATIAPFASSLRRQLRFNACVYLCERRDGYAAAPELRREAARQRAVGEQRRELKAADEGRQARLEDARGRDADEREGAWIARKELKNRGIGASSDGQWQRRMRRIQRRARRPSLGLNQMACSPMHSACSRRSKRRLGRLCCTAPRCRCFRHELRVCPADKRCAGEQPTAAVATIGTAIARLSWRSRRRVEIFLDRTGALPRRHHAPGVAAARACALQTFEGRTIHPHPPPPLHRRLPRPPPSCRSTA